MAKVLPRHVIRATSQVTGITQEALAGEARMHNITFARKVAYHAAIRLGIGMAVFARALNRDHTTISKVLTRNRTVVLEERAIAEVMELAVRIAEESEQRLQVEARKLAAEAAE